EAFSAVPSGVPGPSSGDDGPAAARREPWPTRIGETVTGAGHLRGPEPGQPEMVGQVGAGLGPGGRPGRLLEQRHSAMRERATATAEGAADGEVAGRLLAPDRQRGRDPDRDPGGVADGAGQTG